ncbi:MAG: 5-(carboxyamino)imidazole ribonucleotide synthase [Thermoleophilia bacterium]|nr:5-(carboxyamino)imidazole ribonucleotide synthase [Thermoleophilia bacterium]
MPLVACIGGGQLGRMLGLAGIPLGLRFRFLDPSADACAAAVGELVVGAYDDAEALARLADGADVVTYEFENVPVEAAERIGALPGPAALREGQDRLREKQLFTRLGIPTARYGSLEELGAPALVKKRRLGYDGKGQRRADAVEQLAVDELAEEIVPFDRELSVVAVRGHDGQTRFWPLAENVHRDGVLRVSRAPAVDAPQSEAQEIATALLDELGYVGVLAVELFEVGGRLLANEFAPRVHNTGHWTIDGAVTSQFENHLRALLGLPLGDTSATASSVMVNLVGGVPPREALHALPGAHVHLYGKEPRAGRKLGHVTLVGAAEEAVAEAIRLADGASARG